jgi:protein-S-isoprenylcysteine O-methyltransferase Ste14
MNPYFDTHHVAGVLTLVTTLCWGAMESGHLGNRREGAAKVGGAGSRLGALSVLAVATAAIYLAPHLFPAAAIRHAALAFGIGLAVMIGGLVLRGWAVLTLGQYFTGTVAVSGDQPVVTAGPYRVLRHPSYTGLLLAMAGLGLASANWAGFAATAVITLAGILWRIHAEEHALMATLGAPYQAYAARHKRLVPLVW